MMPAVMKRFVLEFELKSRTNPGKVTITAVAQEEQSARALDSRQNTEWCSNTVWTDPAQTSCRSRKTTQKTPGILSIEKR